MIPISSSANISSLSQLELALIYVILKPYFCLPDYFQNTSSISIELIFHYTWDIWNIHSETYRIFIKVFFNTRGCYEIFPEVSIIFLFPIIPLTRRAMQSAVMNDVNNVPYFSACSACGTVKVVVWIRSKKSGDKYFSSTTCRQKKNISV